MPPGRSMTATVSRPLLEVVQNGEGGWTSPFGVGYRKGQVLAHSKA